MLACVHSTYSGKIGSTAGHQKEVINAVAVPVWFCQSEVYEVQSELTNHIITLPDCKATGSAATGIWFGVPRIGEICAVRSGCLPASFSY